MNTQKCKVKCLPTNEEDNYIVEDDLFIDDERKLQKANAHFGRMPKWTKQHLYFISDEPIKEGDWYYYVPIKDILQTKRKNPKAYPSEYPFEHYQKIIACTNNKTGLPGIEESFIQKYAEKQGSIKLVELLLE